MINPPSVPELLAELEVFRESVATVAAAGSLDWLDSPEGGWSLTEVMCHLRDVEREVHQPRIRALLFDEQAFLPGINADEWADERAYRAQDGRSAAAEYLQARDGTIAMLQDLPQDAWARTGQHTFFGPTSLREIVYLAVQHDRVHSKQIAALIEHLNDER